MQYAPYIRIAEGANTAVLLIHGIVGTPAHFKDLLPLIPDTFSIYNILLDGHGKGVAEFGKTSMTKWRAQVSRQIEEILKTHEKVLIVAHSMGTLFAIDEAIRHPDRVKGLFLLSVPLIIRFPPSTMVNSFRAALGLTKEGSTARAMAEDAGVHLSPNLFLYITWIPRFLELLAACSRTKKQLPALTVSARAYSCRKDELVSCRTCRFLEEHPAITHTLLSRSGHFAYGPEDTALLQADFKEMLQHI